MKRYSTGKDKASVVILNNCFENPIPAGHHKYQTGILLSASKYTIYTESAFYMETDNGHSRGAFITHPMQGV